jgi:hypothetical protein
MHSESLFRSARCSTISVHEYDRQTVAAECVSQHSRLVNDFPNMMDGGQTNYYFLQVDHNQGGGGIEM